MSDIFGGASSSGAADPDLMQRLLRYTGATPPDPRLAGGGPPAGPPPAPPNAFQGAFGNIHDWLAARMAGGQANTITDPRQRALADASAQLNAGPPLNVNAQPTLGPNNPLAQAAAIPTALPPAAPAAAPPSRAGGIGSDANFPVMGAGGFPTTYAPPGQQPAMPTPVAATPLPPVQPKVAGKPAPVRRAAPAARIPASATASVPAGSPWITSGYQNRDVTGGVLSRNGGREMGMLDLSKLFSR